MTELSYEEVIDIVDQVETYLEYQCDSRQEALSLLCQLLSYPDYIDSDLYDLAVQEAQAALKDFEENWIIVKTPKTVTITEVDLVEK